MLSVGSTTRCTIRSTFRRTVFFRSTVTLLLSVLLLSVSSTVSAYQFKMNNGWQPGGEYSRTRFTCKRCGHKWEPKTVGFNTHCPKCGPQTSRRFDQLPNRTSSSDEPKRSRALAGSASDDSSSDSSSSGRSYRRIARLIIFIGIAAFSGIGYLIKQQKEKKQKRFTHTHAPATSSGFNFEQQAAGNEFSGEFSGEFTDEFSSTDNVNTANEFSGNEFAEDFANEFANDSTAQTDEFAADTPTDFLEAPLAARPAPPAQSPAAAPRPPASASTSGINRPPPAAQPAPIENRPPPAAAPAAPLRRPPPPQS